LGLLLDEVTKDPFKDPSPATIARASKLIQIMVPGGQVRPAETHYLVMLHRQLSTSRDQRPPLSDLRESLIINRYAEEVALGLGICEVAGIRAPFHPYSERVFPWIKDLVLKADQERRWGQDLLFASDPASWDQARAYLKAAKEDYDKAAADGAVVRRAYRTRDQLMDVLPSYSHLLACHWVPKTDQKDVDERLKKDMDDKLIELEDLWKKVHQLHQALERLNPQPLHPRVAAVGQPAETLDTITINILAAFKRVDDQFEQRRKSLVRSTAIRAQSRREMDDILAAFWIHPEDRLKLLESSRQLSRELFERHLLRDPGAQPSPGESSSARAAGQQQGRMALAILGERWINQQAKGATMDYTALVRYVANPEPDRWDKQLTEAGDQIGQHWRDYPPVLVGPAVPQPARNHLTGCAEFIDRRRPTLPPNRRHPVRFAPC
jgi:hypothetical protein